ncbi:hypothetical protein ACO34A_07355 [Rhizobium sp. ACO-34A]|nr:MULTISPECIES: hypothetical protein [Rhizobium/Agrobacterium group]ATN33622.1 hypothetical protein ACO34A_07355 [Rhizobium sp. ACO-34A]
MTEDEFDTLSGPEKKQRCLVSLTRKVALAQSAAENPGKLPNNLSIPPDRKRLREWYAPSLGLWTWSYVKLDYEHGVNKDLITAFYQALSDINDLTSTNNSQLKRQIKEQSLIIERLELRTVHLLQRISRIHVALKEAGFRDEDIRNL